MAELSRFSSVNKRSLYRSAPAPVADDGEGTDAEVDVDRNPSSSNT